MKGKEIEKNGKQREQPGPTGINILKQAGKCIHSCIQDAKKICAIDDTTCNGNNTTCIDFKEA